MSFIIAPSSINGQPGFMFDWEAKLRCFYDKDLYTWVIVDDEHTTPVVEAGDETLRLRDYLYNGEPVWGNYGAVFNSVADGWIYNPRGLVEPFAEKDLDGETWIGDGWWAAGKPNGRYPEIACEPRGTFQNEGEGGDPPTLVWKWPRWQWEKAGSSRAPWGTYAGKDGAEEEAPVRVVGSQQFRDDRRKYWILAMDRKSLSCSDGRIIRFVEDDNLWILGVKGIGKWWQTPAGPDRESGMTLDPWRHDDATDDDVPDPEGVPLALSFYNFIATEGTGRLYMAEVALWR